MDGMKCLCGKMAQYTENLRFNRFKIDGWKCNKCGEEYYNPEKAEIILIANKLKKSGIKARLGRIRSNLILRIPKNVEAVLNLHQSGEVILKVENNELKVIPA